MRQRIALEQMGERILDSVKTELYLSMRFFGSALDALGYQMDLSTTTVGTDAVYIRYNPNYLMRTFVEDPRRLNRTYVHILMHCLFRHMFAAGEYEDHELWDLCCDIAAESVVDSMDYPPISGVIRDSRQEVYRTLKEKVGVLTAERLYRYFCDVRLDYNEQVRLSSEFALDDHSFWLRLDEQKKDENPPAEAAPAPVPPAHIRDVTEEEWKRIAGRVKAETVNIGQEAGKEPGTLTWTLNYELKRRTNYREFLRRFTVVREEAGIDMDSFDPGYYNYGMMLYGNMPLIEENEFREARKVEELVIAIDTSQSCENGLVQNFLNETADILLSSGSFFHRVNIHVLQCDDRVNSDTLITSVEQMKEYADGFEIRGGGGTDFRPVFSYVEELRRKRVLKNLKGLMYFTDGYGIYPKHATDYDTAFVFWKDDGKGDAGVPDWALKLYV